MRTVGRLPLTRTQLLARSVDTNSPVSVPTYSTSGFLTSSVIVLTTCPARLAATNRHVWPKSPLAKT